MQVYVSVGMDKNSISPVSQCFATDALAENGDQVGVEDVKRFAWPTLQQLLLYKTAKSKSSIIVIIILYSENGDIFSSDKSCYT